MECAHGKEPRPRLSNTCAARRGAFRSRPPPRRPGPERHQGAGHLRPLRRRTAVGRAYRVAQHAAVHRQVLLEALGGPGHAASDDRGGVSSMSSISTWLTRAPDKLLIRCSHRVSRERRDPRLEPQLVRYAGRRGSDGRSSGIRRPRTSPTSCAAGLEGRQRDDDGAAATPGPLRRAARRDPDAGGPRTVHPPEGCPRGPDQAIPRFDWSPAWA